MDMVEFANRLFDGHANAVSMANQRLREKKEAHQIMTVIATQLDGPFYQSGTLEIGNGYAEAVFVDPETKDNFIIHIART